MFIHKALSQVSRATPTTCGCTHGTHIHMDATHTHTHTDATHTHTHTDATHTHRHTQTHRRHTHAHTHSHMCVGACVFTLPRAAESTISLLRLDHAFFLSGTAKTSVDQASSVTQLQLCLCVFSPQKQRRDLQIAISEGGNAVRADQNECVVEL